MSEKIELKNQNVEIHFEHVNVGNGDFSYAIYIFVGDVIIGSMYGTKEEMECKYQKIVNGLKEELS